MSIINKVKSNAKLKKFVLWTISPNGRPRPRLWVRLFLNPFVHKKGKNALIRSMTRMDVFPWKKFEIGDNSTIETFCVVNNGAGDVIIGKNARLGIGSVLLGPVKMGDGSGCGQHVFIGGFNHGYSDGNQNSKYQALEIRPTTIEDEAHIGANSVILPGITIGRRSQIGAGSVVTRDVPPLCIAVGNPARVIKRLNPETGNWEKTI